ncbi:putative SMG7-like 2 [Homarus americanus]|uniref:Putative SMG7-like 2 n=2 Tax=Homarus americanus TaxID=6706 RepID=A0A8J5K709_HOMAM|nr:putative SMG7-like 2 [Homarus americanus]
MKRNSAMQEAKQVTFKTPSPAISPNPSEASSDSHRSQLSTPPLMPPSSQRDPMSSSPMPHHLGQMYQINTPPQGQGTSFVRQNQPTENNFSNQQHQQFGGQPPWGGVSGMSGNVPSQHGIGRPLHQQNQPMNSGPNFNMQRNGSGPSPQNVLQQQMPTSTPSHSDILTAGVFNRPPLEGFHQLSGPVPPRPGVDISNRMREPAPRMLEMMGMTRAPPSFGPVEGLGNPCRMRPPGTEGQGLENSPRMTQAPFRPHQEMDPVTSQAKMNHITHPLLSPGAMNAHLYGMDGRQNVSGSSGPGVSGPRNMFGESDMGPPRGPGLSPPMGMGWGPGHNEGKSYMNHPPPTLANLLQQHAPVDIRLNLPMDHSSDQLNPGLARLPGGPSVHNPAMNTRSPPGVGPLGAVPLGILSMPSTQPPGSIPHNQPPRGQQSFMQEGGEGDGPSGNTYSLFSPMSGGSMGMGAGPSRTVPHPLYPSNSQPSGQQSLWSGPGPSPLERLLEQKKYSNVPK